MSRFVLFTLTALVASAAIAGAAPPATTATTATVVDFCVTPDGICPLPRPAAPGTPCSCRWPRGTTSQGQAGE